MVKPPFRDFDQNPKRNDDIRVTGFGMTFEANGTVLIQYTLQLITLGLVCMLAWFLLELARNQEITTCVLTLNEQERKEYRTEGKYCGGYHQRRTIKFRDDGAANIRDERHRHSQL